MKPLRYLPHYTYEDYARWEGKWELIQGMPYDMSPSPKRNHQFLGSIVLNEITNSLKEKHKQCDDCHAYYDLDWIINNETVVRPDIMIVCGKFEEDFLRFPPALVVEILSPQTAIKDRTVKFDLYEQQLVKYYVLLNPENKSQKIYELKNGSYIETNISQFELQSTCHLSINFQSLIDGIR